MWVKTSSFRMGEILNPDRMSRHYSVARGAPVPFQGLRTTEYDEACGSCGKRVLCVFQGAVGAFLASTAPAASTGSPVRTARAGTFTTTDVSSADRSGAPTGPCALSAWGGSVPRPERPWETSSGESRHERQYRDEGTPRSADLNRRLLR